MAKISPHQIGILFQVALAKNQKVRNVGIKLLSLVFKMNGIFKPRTKEELQEFINQQAKKKLQSLNEQMLKKYPQAKKS